MADDLSHSVDPSDIEPQETQQIPQGVDTKKSDVSEVGEIKKLDKIISSLNLNQIISDTDEDRKDRAQHHLTGINLVKVYQLGKNFTSLNQIDKRQACTFEFLTRSISGHEYHNFIRFQMGIGYNLPVKVSCTCPDFMYSGSAYVLNSYNALYNPSNYKRIAISQRPDIKNPNLKKLICKHLIGLIISLENEGILR